MTCGIITNKMQMKYIRLIKQEVRDGWCVSRLKCNYDWGIFNWKCNKQGANHVFRCESVTNKVQLRHLRLKSNKKGTAAMFRG